MNGGRKAFEHVAGFLVLQFKHERDPAARRRQWFDAAQESDGTLRVAGIITALLQRPRPEPVAIEEPELTVHPGAIRLLYDYIKEGSLDGQVVLTTHSPDLLSLLSADEVRVVERIDDETHISPLDEAQREVVRRGLFSLGDVMRSEGLRPKQLELPVEGELVEGSSRFWPRTSVNLPPPIRRSLLDESSSRAIRGLAKVPWRRKQVRDAACGGKRTHGKHATRRCHRRARCKCAIARRRPLDGGGAELPSPTARRSGTGGGPPRSDS